MRGVCKLYAGLFQPFNIYIILGLGSEECGIVWEETKGRCGLGLGLSIVASTERRVAYVCGGVG
jgi:hypothetical protein